MSQSLELITVKFPAFHVKCEPRIDNVAKLRGRNAARDTIIGYFGTTGPRAKRIEIGNRTGVADNFIPGRKATVLIKDKIKEEAFSSTIVLEREDIKGYV